MPDPRGPSTFCKNANVRYFFFFALAFCVRADAAAVLASLLDFGLRKTFEAALAAFGPVASAL